MAVMAGLVPAIHAVELQTMAYPAWQGREEQALWEGPRAAYCSGTAWMAGTSPAMTLLPGLMDVRSFPLRRNRLASTPRACSLRAAI